MIDKFIGDAIMCIFGTPFTCDNHARKALEAALDLKVVSERFGTWMANRHPEIDAATFGIGIGLHTGEVVVGNIGSPNRMEFTVIGDTVNTASRIEGLTKQMGCVILAGHETVLAAGPGVLIGRSAELPVKGKALPVAVYEITGLSTKENVS
jgi:class 3 adenylate cyclase